MIREGFENPSPGCLRTPLEYRQRAAEVYRLYSTAYRSRFKWLSPSLFQCSACQRSGGRRRAAHPGPRQVRRLGLD